MHQYLQQHEDSLALRQSGPWVAEKLDYLQRYINIFETSMRNKPWRRRNYIDLFSGSGKCIVDEPRTVYLGSPLLAVTTQYPFTNYYFVDQNRQNIADLQERCSVSSVSDQIQYFVGDSNVVAREIVDHVLSIDRQRMPGQYSSLNLAFLDPEGLEMHWETIAALAQPYTMDLIIHYPQGGLNRYMGQACQEKEQTAIDLFFGGFDWRTIYERYGNNHRLLIDHYKGKLQEVGYREVLRDDEVGDEPLMRNAQRRAPLYRLLFASKNPLGHDFWRAVTRSNVHGQARLF